MIPLAPGLRPFISRIHWMSEILSDHPLVLGVVPRERRATHHDDASPCSRFHILRMLELIYLNSETVRNEDEGVGMEGGPGRDEEEPSETKHPKSIRTLGATYEAYRVIVMVAV